MEQRRHPWFISAPALGVVIWSFSLGCDIGYGVWRSARLAKPIDVSCVPRSLKQVPGVSQVEHHHKEPNTCSWPHPTDTLDQFIFSGEKIWGVVSIEVKYKGEAQLRMYHMQLNRKPPQDVIDRTRQAMDAAEPLLNRECEGFFLTTRIEERCRGVSCNR